MRCFALRISAVILMSMYVGGCSTGSLLVSALPSGLELQDALVCQSRRKTADLVEVVDPGSRCLLHAGGEDWTLEVYWHENEHRRLIRWNHIKNSERSGIEIWLKSMPWPLDEMISDATPASYGSCQPGVAVWRNGESWEVRYLEAHVDFRAGGDLAKFLASRCHDDRRVAVSSNGAFVGLDIDNTEQGHISVDIEILFLTVQGSRPSESILAPLLRGRISRQRP